MVGLLIAAAVSMLVSLFGTRFLIDWLRARRVGQPIHEDVQGHSSKSGTPTMGGLAIVGAALIGYVVPHFLRRGVIFTYSGLLLMLAVAGAAIVGLLDDWIKVKYARNLGLSKRAKTLGLLAVAITFAVLVVAVTEVHTTLSFTRFDSPGIKLGNVAWVILAVLMIYGSSNAVNLTDGLDGLAAGASAFAFSCFTVIGFWEFRHEEIYQIDHAYDLAICATALLGACVGFLWWNANPAHIFMGDTGSLAIGTALAGLSLLTSTELLLPIVGGLFVFETVSVIIQVSVFRVFDGRRVFRMAPIHHHFELSGWPETVVIVRFWILAGLLTALALGIYYADFIRIPGVLE